MGVLAMEMNQGHRSRTGTRELSFSLIILLTASVGAFAQSPPQSTLDQWKATLQYGINSQILDLIGTLKNQQDGRLNKELIDVFNSTYDDSLRSAIVDLFVTLQYQGAETAMRDFVGTNPDNLGLLDSCLSYLAGTITHPEKKTVDLIASFISNQNSGVSATAIRGIGTIATRDGTKAYDFTPVEKTLLDLLQANGTSQDIQENIVLTLGSLKAQQAVKALISILEDTGQPIVLREYAANSLGKIGDMAAIKPLSALLRDSNSMLRAYAVDAMSYFKTPEVDPMLIASLKDSFARVRSSALAGVARNKLVTAIPAVIFKAEHDPDSTVQLAAIKTLGELGTSECWDALRSIYENTNLTVTRRGAALDQLVSGDLAGSLPSIEKVVKENWGTAGERTLDMTAKRLSTVKAPELKSLFARFLGHPNPIIEVYGMRGISLNGFSDLKAEIEKLGGQYAPAYLKEQVKRTIDSLGGGSPATTPGAK